MIQTIHDVHNFGYRVTTLLISNERNPDIPKMKIILTLEPGRQFEAIQPDQNNPYILDLRLSGAPGPLIKQTEQLLGVGCCDREFTFRSDGAIRVMIVKLYSLDRGRVYVEQTNGVDETRVILRALNFHQIEHLIYDGQTLQPIFEPIP